MSSGFCAPTLDEALTMYFSIKRILLEGAFRDLRIEVALSGIDFASADVRFLRLTTAKRLQCDCDVKHILLEGAFRNLGMKQRCLALALPLPVFVFR